jgi:hypothetical protein
MTKELQNTFLTSVMISSFKRVAIVLSAKSTPKLSRLLIHIWLWKVRATPIA